MIRPLQKVCCLILFLQMATLPATSAQEIAATCGPLEIKILRKDSCPITRALEAQLREHGITKEDFDNGYRPGFDVDTSSGTMRVSVQFFEADGSPIAVAPGGSFGTPQIQFWQNDRRVSVESNRAESADDLIAHAKSFLIAACR